MIELETMKQAALSLNQLSRLHMTLFALLELREGYDDKAIYRQSTSAESNYSQAYAPGIERPNMRISHLG
jgi:hypothetical protein